MRSHLLILALSGALATPFGALAHEGPHGHVHAPAAPATPPAAAKAQPAAKTEKKPAVPAAIAHVERSGAAVIETFRGPGELTGWAVEKNGERRVFYTTPSGMLISGLVFDARGRSLIELDLARTAAGQPGGEHERAWKLAEAGGAFYRDLPRGGAARGKSPVYVFVDLGCPYSRRLWDGIRVIPGYDDAEIRWIPVATVSNPSSGIQDFIMAKSREEATRAFISPTPEMVSKALSRPAADGLRVNDAAFKETTATGVPALLFRDAHGISRVIVGAPDPNVLGLILSAR